MCVVDHHHYYIPAQIIKIRTWCPSICVLCALFSQQHKPTRIIKELMCVLVCVVVVVVTLLSTPRYLSPCSFFPINFSNLDAVEHIYLIKIFVFLFSCSNDTIR